MKKDIKNVKRMSRLFQMQKYSYDLNKIAVIYPNNFDKIFLFEDGVLSESNKKDISKKSLISSYIPSRYINNFEIKIAKNLIDKVNLYDHIETKLYEEFELDGAEKYIFKYKLINSVADEKNTIANVFVLKEGEIKDYLKPIINKYDYLDYFAYRGFLFEVLYKKKILTPNKDIFLYFTKDSSTITLYADGVFLQEFVLDENLKNLYTKLKEDPEIDIEYFSYELFIELLTKKGVNPDYYDDNEEILFNKLSKLFCAVFMKALNQLNYLQRKFTLRTIDRIFISTENGIIPGVEKLAKNSFGEIEIKKLKFDTKYNPNDIQIDQLCFLTLLTTQYAYQEDEQEYNFTIKRRPPTFFYRKSGQFISLTIASLLLAILYPSYQYVMSTIKDYQNSSLKTKLNKLTSQANMLGSANSRVLREYRNDKKQKEKKEKYINDIAKIITTLHKEKNGYVPVSSTLIKISTSMGQNHIHTKSISFDENSINFDISAPREYYITNFVKTLVKKDNFDVNTTGIIRDENGTKYKSVIKVGL